VKARILSPVSLLVLFSTFVAADASAGAIGLNGTTLVVVGDSGDDVITAIGSATDLLITTSSPPGILPAACTPVGTGVRCVAAGITLLAVLGGFGDDVLDMGGVDFSLDVFLSGGPGEDVLIAGDGADILKGGAGDDILIGRTAADTLFGGPGDNVLLFGTIGEGDGPPDPELPTGAVPEPGLMMLVAWGLGASALTRITRPRT
jgi:Ca2+-binding RTX toxin-like protein